MKLILPVLCVLLASCCNQNNSQNESLANTEPYDSAVSIPLILPPSLETRRSEFLQSVNNALKIIKDFAGKHGWTEHLAESFPDSVMIFDNKSDFSKTLLKLAGADTAMVLPETYCAALEKRTLTIVSPEIYAEVYPQGIESCSYEKLMAHEIAHRLHIRILDGNEEAMGPVWFFEGFAIYAAGQFSLLQDTLTKPEIIGIINNPERGSYSNYGIVFRHFIKKYSLKELIIMSKEKNFNEALVRKVEEGV